MATGVLPPLLLMARRPEDMGMAPDGLILNNFLTQRRKDAKTQGKRLYGETWTTRCGKRCGRPAFWILAFFSMVGFMAQAGVSLHQTAHYVDAGVSHGTGGAGGDGLRVGADSWRHGVVTGGAADAGAGDAGDLGGVADRRACSASGSAAPAGLGHSIYGFLFGAGVGGLHTLLRLAWADYYGRVHLGAIRGLTLPAQIGGQAIGPVVSGFMFDASGGYLVPFVIFGSAVALSALLVLAAVPPSRRAPSSAISPSP